MRLFLINSTTSKNKKISQLTIKDNISNKYLYSYYIEQENINQKYVCNKKA